MGLLFCSCITPSSYWRLAVLLAQDPWHLSFPTAGPLEEEQFGFPSFSGISRLTWLVSLFGELSLVSATLEEQKEDKYMKMTVRLETKSQR